MCIAIIECTYCPFSLQREDIMKPRRKPISGMRQATAMSLGESTTHTLVPMVMPDMTPMAMEAIRRMLRPTCKNSQCHQLSRTQKSV